MPPISGSPRPATVLIPVAAPRCVAGVRLSIAVLVLFLSLALPIPALAQTGSLQGRVRDEQGGTVEGAGVVARASSGGEVLGSTASDALGYFRFDGLPVGPGVAAVRRLGFAERTVEFVVQEDEIATVAIELVVQALEVAGVTADAARSVAGAAFVREPGLTVRAIEASGLRTLPGLIEPDPLRAAATLPGVVTTSDFSGAYNVRGGSADQNLILLDGLPVFNPAHLGGLFSVFNPDMIRRVTLRSGGFPAEYGGRVSSVLEVESDPGDGTFGIDGAISLLTARVAVGGGLSEGVKGALGLRDARWRVSGRQSYFHVLLAPVVDFPYRLGDIQTVFEGWTRGGDRVSFAGYTGGDVLDLSGSEDSPLGVDWGWGNDVVGARWTHLAPDGAVVDSRVGFSRFSTGLALPDFADTDLASEISQVTLAVDWEHHPAAGLVTKVGVEGRRLNYENRFMSGGTEFIGGSGAGWGGAAFAQLLWTPSEAWLVEPGVRVDAWYPGESASAFELSPRLSVKRFVAGGTAALKASVGRFTQYLHSIRDEELPLGLDLWVLAGPEAPHIVSDQLQGGFEVSPGDGWLLSVEGYARDFGGVITMNSADDPNDERDDYLQGRGYSYGVDALVERAAGATTGWLAISWLRTRRRFPDFTSGLDPAPEVEYAPIFDRRWDVDLVLSRGLGDRTEVGLRWNLGTGLPFTRPVGVFPFLSPHLTSGLLEWEEAEEGSAPLGVLVGARNGARYPLYHRLDISVRRRYEPGWGTVTPYLSVLNTYNRKNVLFYVFEYDGDPATRSGYSMFPALATFGAEVSFR